MISENFSDIERGLYCNCHRMTVTAGCPLPGLEQMRFSPGEGKAGLFFEIWIYGTQCRGSCESR